MAEPTPNQRKFAEGLADGKSPVEAYTAAYPDSKHSTIITNAPRVARTDAIVKLVREIKRERQPDASSNKDETIERLEEAAAALTATGKHDKAANIYLKIAQIRGDLAESEGDDDIIMRIQRGRAYYARHKDDNEPILPEAPDDKIDKQQ